MAQTGPRSFRQLSRQIPNKPVAFTEFGYSSGVEDTTSIDQEGIHLHNGLWGALFSGYASTAMYWWWDSYLDPLGLWPHFRGISTFMAGEDLADFSPVQVTISTTETTGSGLGAVGLGLKSDEQHLVWLRSRNYAAQSAIYAYEDALKAGNTEEWRFEPPRVEGLLLTLDKTPEGTYQVHWFDPQTSEWLSQDQVIAQGGSINLPVPAFDRDLAIKIRRDR
jgi:hypothetical protein